MVLTWYGRDNLGLHDICHTPLVTGGAGDCSACAGLLSELEWTDCSSTSPEGPLETSEGAVEASEILSSWPLAAEAAASGSWAFVDAAAGAFLPSLHMQGHKSLTACRRGHH